MRDVIRQSWLAFTEPLEGGICYPYADIRNLITVAYGSLIDPMSLALGLPFLDAETGAPATHAQIAAGWQRIKNDPAAARMGHLYARGLTTLRLTPQGMADLALGKLEANDAHLRGRFDNFEDWPACAQMAIHSLAWACGPAFNFPKLAEACNASDWEVAAIHIRMNEYTPEGLHNAGLRARNVRNVYLMQNAARVRDFKLDPDLLDWTHVLGVADADTVPELPNPASEPTICVPPIVHVDPTLYRLEVDPDEPPDAA